MVNALEPSDLCALHCRIRKFDFHLKSGGRGVRFSKKLLLGEQGDYSPPQTRPRPEGTPRLSRPPALTLMPPKA